MSTTIKIRKVNTLPGTLEPSTLYLYKEGATQYLIVTLTDKNGSVAYSTRTATDINSIVTTAINAIKNQPNGIAGLDESGNLIANISSAIYAAAIDGQSVDIRSNGVYVWEDLKAPFVVRSLNGGNNPSWGTLFGNLQGYLWGGGTLTQLWQDFHIDHDIAMGTKVYPHVHWCPTTNHTGTVRWGFEYSVAKGHGQEAFAATTIVYVNHTITQPSRWVHFVTEVPEVDAIPSSSIEPDTVIKMRIFRDGAHYLDTYNYNVHAWEHDLHYQVAQLGTRGKAPDFFA
jgi:hypothetical protein